MTNYGPAALMDGLANTTCGNGNGKVAMGFRASHSEPLASIRYFHQYTGGAGYALGTGGTFRFTIEADSAGFPSGTPLATKDMPALGSNSLGRLVTFDTPATLTAGTLYWLVIQNTDAAPLANYSSPNFMWKHEAAAPDPMIPRYPNADWRVAYFDASWHLRGGYAPILQLNWGTSGAEGGAYVELAYTAGHYVQIDSTNWARHRFTPTVDLDIAAIAFRAVITAGNTGALTAEITETAGGALVASASIPATSFAAGTATSYDTSAPAAMDWSVAPASGALKAGTGYTITFKAPAGTTYYTFPMRRGDIGFGYDAKTVFADGQVAEKSANSGGSWANCTANGGTADVDLQFYIVGATYHSAYRDSVVALLPKAYWRMGEASGVVAADEMGAYPGTYVGAPTLGAAGAIAGDANTAVTFNGTTQYITGAAGLQAAASIGTTGALTIAAWIKPTDVTGNKMIATKWSSDPNVEYQLYRATTGVTFQVLSTTSASLVNVNKASCLSAGTAALVVVTVVNGGAVNLYVNNLAPATGTMSASRAATTSDFQVGVRAGALFTNDTLDEVTVWDRALTAGEIAALYARGAAGSRALKRLLLRI